jgi:L-threonylcarbamoyladenylate synthase
VIHLGARGRWEDIIFQPTQKAIQAAADILRSGQLAAFPTETVYGLGADATNDDAVAAIFRAKGRPQTNPLIIHVSGASEAWKLARIDARAERAADAFWPGALTLVLERIADCPVTTRASAGLPTLAVRAPDHPIAQAVLRASELPLAAPSANLSGHVSPTTAQHVADGLGGSVDMILDGEPCAIGVESTVLALDGDVPTILRPGAISAEALADALGEAVKTLAPSHSEMTSGPARSPGTMPSHYAPRAEIRLNATTVAGNEGLLAFGDAQPPGAAITRNLSAKADLTEAAGHLYAALRDLDQSGVKVIAVVPIPNTGIGIAINDRLNRAAAPRG